MTSISQKPKDDLDYFVSKNNIIDPNNNLYKMSNHELQKLDYNDIIKYLNKIFV